MKVMKEANKQLQVEKEAFKDIPEDIAVEDQHIRDINNDSGERVTRTSRAH